MTDDCPDYAGVSYQDPADGEIISFDFSPGEEIPDVVVMNEIDGSVTKYYRISG